jgi:hypothetical protein
MPDFLSMILALLLGTILGLANGALSPDLTYSPLLFPWHL